MLLEAVTVCVNSASALKHCVDNRKLLDRWVVVTTANDLDTIALCRQYEIETLFSERLYADGALFAKGRALNEGFETVSRQGWLIAMDADIILPGNFRNIVQQIPEDESSCNCIYGPKLRRMVNNPPAEYNQQCTSNIENLQGLYTLYYELFSDTITQGEPLSYEQYDQFLMQAKQQGLLESNIPPTNEQWRLFNLGEWHKLPINFEGHMQHNIGYFQMFHGSTFTGYSEFAQDHRWDDVIFKNQYEKHHRKVIDFECVHIGMNSYIQKRQAQEQVDGMFPAPMGVSHEQLAGDELFDYMDQASYLPLKLPM